MLDILAADECLSLRRPSATWVGGPGTRRHARRVGAGLGVHVGAEQDPDHDRHRGAGELPACLGRAVKLRVG